MEGFGQTETTLLIGNLVGDTPRPGSMGKPTPQYDVKVMLPDGTLAEPEEDGEILIRTEEGVPNRLFMCYYGDEEKTNNAPGMMDTIIQVIPHIMMKMDTFGMWAV